jgi:hypothetical protein
MGVAIGIGVGFLMAGHRGFSRQAYTIEMGKTDEIFSRHGAAGYFRLGS